MPQLSLSVQYVDANFDWSAVLPRPLLRRWVKAALQQDASLTLRFVGTLEAQTLNRDYRGKDYATNVLTFAYGDDDASLDDLPAEVRLALAEQHGAQIEADIVLCGDVLQREAAGQGKTLLAHAAHLVVHGVLHAQGYDHLDDAQADEMEGLERNILAKLSFADPYAGEGARLED